MEEWSWFGSLAELTGFAGPHLGCKCRLGFLLSQEAKSTDYDVSINLWYMDGKKGREQRKTAKCNRTVNSKFAESLQQKEHKDHCLY